MEVKKLLIITLHLIIYVCFASYAQGQVISGTVKDQWSMEALAGAVITVPGSNTGTVTDENGAYKLELPQTDSGKILVVSMTGYQPDSLELTPVKAVYDFRIKLAGHDLDQVVISGTMKQVSKSESPILIEVYTPAFFKKNPTANVFEALTMVNGVQPQLNCNVCNTGDIHINGMEGPYTMVLIDGMPIVSSLSTVYGLSGIPNSLVKRIEVVKGPASTLYGSEAIGGLINIITQAPAAAPRLSIDAFATSWEEYNVDISSGFALGKAKSLLGVNSYYSNTIFDKNADGFTDAPLQKRLSVFNKWDFGRKNGKTASLALRYVHENRWGGQTNWTPEWRGTDSIYGESIYTRRFELIGSYGLPIQGENLRFDYSFNTHHQDSYYGQLKYLATQHTAFAQLIWDKKAGNHDLLLGLPFRFISYDDNTPATESFDPAGMINRPSLTYLPGVFAQDEWHVSKAFTMLAGLRYDHNNNHGNIFTPRLSFKYAPNTTTTIRLSGGNGYRVVNLFTEDHAALTGARDVVITETLKPERSWNANLNYSVQLNHSYGFTSIDLSGFYAYFTNQIVGDFDTDPNKIIYDNLKGYAISKGITLNTEFTFTNSLKLLLGGTLMDVYRVGKNSVGENEKSLQLFAPHFSGTYAVSYTFPRLRTSIDLTGTIKSPMRLPVLPNDYRPEFSPWFSLMNAQLTKKVKAKLEVYAGIKNLLNFVPKDPIMRANDPFDKDAGNTVTNPNGYTFDASYNYAPLQGRRLFVGLRYSIR